MKRIMKADLYRILKGKGIYITFIVLAFLCLGNAFGMSALISISLNTGDTSVSETIEKKELNDLMNSLSMDSIDEDNPVKDVREKIMSLEHFKGDKEILSCNSILYYFIIIFPVLAVTVDFTTGSYKNTITVTYNRKKYYTAKFFMVSIMTIVLHTMNTVMVCLFNHFINHGRSDSAIFEIIRIYLLHFFPLLGLSSLLTAIAFFLKKTSLFNTVAIPLCVVYQLIITLPRLFNIKNAFLARFEIDAVFSSLAYLHSPEKIVPLVIYCTVMIIVSYFVGLIGFSRAEIK